jgi:uncharacterized membrane protein YcjF (UPF0283 family)
MSGRGVHRGGTFVLSFAMVAIGVTLFVQSLAQSASALSGRLIIAVLFVAAGVGRIYVEVRRGRGT